MKKDQTFPVYKKSSDGLMAFVSKSEMYYIRNRGSNTGCEGITIDRYITRRMVLQLWESGWIIDESLFERYYNSLFEQVLKKIKAYNS